MVPAYMRGIFFFFPIVKMLWLMYDRYGHMQSNKLFDEKENCI